MIGITSWRISQTFSAFGLLPLDVGTKAIILIDKYSKKKAKFSELLITRANHSFEFLLSFCCSIAPKKKHNQNFI
jgi:hypothetical protein